MSLRTLPILIINLGGEMIYILDQRLRSQNETDDKTQKAVWSKDDRKRVLNDIVGAMFSKPLIDDLVTPGELYSHTGLRCVLARLAHCSILKISQSSVNMLYDLTTVAFKHQVLLCPRPRDLLLISFNHIDAVREMVKANHHLVNQINEAQRRITEMYTPLSDGEFQLLRQTLLTLFQDVHVKVSIFLQDKIQNHDGHFVMPTSGPVPQGTEVPGLIRWFNSRGREVRRRTFPSGGSYACAMPEGASDIMGDRVTHLGTNMYRVTSLSNTYTSGACSDSSSSRQKDTTPSPLAKEELNLLAKLMQGVELWGRGEAAPAVRMSLFSSDLEGEEEKEEEEEEEGAVSTQVHEQSHSTIHIQATKDYETNTKLNRIAAEFSEHLDPSDGPDKGGDLLAMMDKL